jgi:hypothetical protein
MSDGELERALAAADRMAKVRFAGQATGVLMVGGVFLVAALVWAWFAQGVVVCLTVVMIANELRQAWRLQRG